MAPLVRYGGAGVLPWLVRFVREGRLVNVPWSVADCLVLCPDIRAFQTIWTVRVVDDLGTSVMHPGPFAPDGPGDVDGEGPVDALDVPERPTDDANRLVLAWMSRNPDLAFPELVRLGDEGQKRAWVALLAISQGNPERFEREMREAVGDDGYEHAMTKIRELVPRS